MLRAALLTLLLAPGLVRAEFITYQVTGIVGPVDLIGDVPSIATGDPLLALLTFDLAAPDTRPDPQIGVFPTALVSAEVHAGAGYWFWAGSGPGLSTSVQLENLGGGESVDVLTYSTDGLLHSERSTWGWWNYPDMDSITSDTLPFDLSGLANSKLILWDETYVSEFDSDYSRLVHFTATDLTVAIVPAPAAGWLLATGLVALTRARRYAR